MPRIDVKVSYLEMLAPPASPSVPPRDGLTVMHAVRPTIPYYRFLYNAVGEDYAWSSHSRMPDADLKVLLHDPGMEMQVFFVDGVPAGFTELDRRTAGDVEIVQFGLIRDFIGQGLGRYFLEWTVDRAWGGGARRVWLHTCSIDHPVAIPNYVRRGFVLYKEVWIQRDVPEGFVIPATLGGFGQ